MDGKIFLQDQCFFVGAISHHSIISLIFFISNKIVTKSLEQYFNPFCIAAAAL
jgi:hypothetical protein